MLGSHYLLADLLIGDTVGIGTGLCIFREIFEIVGHGKVEQGEPVIEDGRGGKNCSCVVVSQQPKVFEVPILVVDQGIENQHTAKLLIEIVAQVFVVVKASFQRGLPDNPPDGDKRRVYIRKELALGGEDPFPVFKVISDAGNAHRREPFPFAFGAFSVVKHAELKRIYPPLRQCDLDLLRAQIGERLHPRRIFAFRYARNSGAMAADVSARTANARMTRFRIFFVR